MKMEFDPDEWEGISVSREGTWGGSGVLSSDGNMRFGRKRSAIEVAQIKADRERKREDAVLAEADAIRARRLKS